MECLDFFYCFKTQKSATCWKIKSKNKFTSYSSSQPSAIAVHFLVSIQVGALSLSSSRIVAHWWTLSEGHLMRLYNIYNSETKNDKIPKSNCKIGWNVTEIQISIFIGPKSNHCLALSVSPFVGTWLMWPWPLKIHATSPVVSFDSHVVDAGTKQKPSLIITLPCHCIRHPFNASFNFAQIVGFVKVVPFISLSCYMDLSELVQQL